MLPTSIQGPTRLKDQGSARAPWQCRRDHFLLQCRRLPDHWPHGLCLKPSHVYNLVHLTEYMEKNLEKASLHKKAAKVSFSLFKQVWPDWSQVAADSAHELVRSAVHLLEALQPDLNMSTSQQTLYCTSTFSARCPLLLSKFCANGSGHACMAWCAESTGILPASSRRSASTI